VLDIVQRALVAIVSTANDILLEVDR